MKQDNRILFGRIAKPHGVNGEIRLDLKYSGPVDELKLESVFVEIDGKMVPFFLEQISDKGPFAVLKLEGINSFEAAASLNSRSCYVTGIRETRTAKSGISELLSWTVIDKNFGDLGEVVDYEEGAQERLVVKNKDLKILIPFAKPIIQKLEKSTKQIFVDLPDGFLDLYQS